MNTRLFLLLSFNALLTLSSCGQDHLSGVITADSHFKYSMCMNCANAKNECLTDQSQCPGGCTTGAHQYTSEADYCASLRDPALNNFCETNARRDLFQKSGCSGTF